MRYIARLNNAGEEQALVNHLIGVGKKIRSLAANNVYSELAGIVHDIGKYSIAFQEYLRSNSDENKPDHSSAGSQLILSILRNRGEQIGEEEIKRIARLIACMISHCCTRYQFMSQKWG